MNARAIAVAVVVLALAVGGVLLLEQGERPALEGRFYGVTVHGPTATDCVALLDVEVTNTSKAKFEVSHFEALADGVKGDAVAALDVGRLIDAYPALAAKGVPPLLKVGDVLKPGVKTRRAMMVSLAGMSAEKFAGRKSLELKIQEQAGHVSTFVETK